MTTTITKDGYTLLLGDCLDRMREIPDRSVDMVLADLPYGTTQCKWDTVIPLELLWQQYWRCLKDNGAICLFGCEPFSSFLRMHQIERFKYDWIWVKDKATGHLNARKQPLREIENISVFYRNQPTYNPQFYEKNVKNIRPPTRGKQPEIYRESKRSSARTIDVALGYPKQILNFRSCSGDKGKSFHPTQKPIPLLEYLIRTYTKEDGLVLDNTMGSGSTGIAAVNLGRRFIGIEKDPAYFEIAAQRLLSAASEKVRLATTWLRGRLRV